MAEAPAAPLEARRPARGGVLDPAPAGGGVDEARLGVQDLEHLQRVGLPVRREMECAAGLQPVRDERGECRLHDAPLVVALLGPGIRKVQQHFIERMPAPAASRGPRPHRARSGGHW